MAVLGALAKTAYFRHLAASGFALKSKRKHGDNVILLESACDLSFYIVTSKYFLEYFRAASFSKEMLLAHHEAQENEPENLQRKAEIYRSIRTMASCFPKTTNLLPLSEWKPINKPGILLRKLVK